MWAEKAIPEYVSRKTKVDFDSVSILHCGHYCLRVYSNAVAAEVGHFAFAAFNSIWSERMVFSELYSLRKKNGKEYGETSARSQRSTN